MSPIDVPGIARRWRADGAAPAAADAPVAPAAAAPYEVVIDIPNGLALWGSRPQYSRYLRRFVDAHGNVAAVLRAQVRAGDVDAARRLAHQLAGVAASLALPALRGRPP